MSPVPETNVDVFSARLDPSVSIFHEPRLLSPCILVVLASEFLYAGHADSHHSAWLKRAPTFSKKANSLLDRDMFQKVFAVYVSAGIVRDRESLGDIPEDI